MIEAVIVRIEANYSGVLVKLVRNRSKWRNDARGTQRVNSHVCILEVIFLSDWIMVISYQIASWIVLN